MVNGLRGLHPPTWGPLEFFPAGAVVPPAVQMRKLRLGEARGAWAGAAGSHPQRPASGCGKEEAERKGRPPEAWRFPLRQERRGKRRRVAGGAGFCFCPS